ncbi:sqv-8 [Pristionchus pacificus]|uniref:Galactosylgalactosylxylosylprotein 3-beta-glucuronosyltransferase n=1 Tax=Pristionchus pacificus TaxID=54126 RepID=A0A2A6B8Z8_PRIPA|nr:sqv-8 [Pristionchus pacificus]|eukprot:PDM62333.1 sqv-8 [Pristionchus pacificus]
MSDIVKGLLGLLGVLFALNLYMSWTGIEGYKESRMGLQEQIQQLENKKSALQQKVWEMERNVHRFNLRLESLDSQVRDRLQLLSNRKKTSLPMIYFVTPTGFRLEQKADMTRLAQTLAQLNRWNACYMTKLSQALAQVPNLHWIVVEDAETTSKSINDIVKRSRVQFTHIAVATPPESKMKSTDPNCNNLGSSRTGVVYFGDDDNVYDWRLFDEMRRVKRVGVWPVGVVGGLLAEHAMIDGQGVITGFNAIWKPERPFPIDMASFAVNITLVLDNPEAGFSYDVPRGYQESHFLQSCGIANSREMEPLGDYANKASQIGGEELVYSFLIGGGDIGEVSEGLSILNVRTRGVFVWHTRTEKTKLGRADNSTLLEKVHLTPLQKDAIGYD